MDDMADFEPLVPQGSISERDVEVKFSHPSHSNKLSSGDVKTVTPDKHPLNGISKIATDTNGLIDHRQDLSIKSKPVIDGVPKQDLVENHEMCSCANECQLSEQQLCDSESDKCIDQLESDVRLLELNENNESKDIDHLNGIEYVVYQSELQMPDIMRLITKDLSEPYSIYTYRYFIHNWPKLCFLAMDKDKCVGAIVCKLDMHKKMVRRGYIAMLAVDSEYRRKKIGSHLVLKAIKAMIADDCDEVVLETEITNQAALRLYENLGFVRDKRLFRYYLNGVDALRLKLWLR